jgi:hypothetical protein
MVVSLSARRLHRLQASIRRLATDRAGQALFANEFTGLHGASLHEATLREH